MSSFYINMKKRFIFLIIKFFAIYIHYIKTIIFNKFLLENINKLMINFLAIKFAKKHIKMKNVNL